MRNIGALAVLCLVGCAATQEGNLAPDAKPLPITAIDAADPIPDAAPPPDAPAPDAPLPDAPLPDAPPPDAPTPDAPPPDADQSPDACVSKPEICNHVDDNCNGFPDEGYLVGAPCMAGKGECLTMGMLVCNEAGTGTVCDADPKEPAPIDYCKNGKDDDCDGATDEDFPLWGTICYRGTGDCREAGQMLCNDEDDGLECNAVPSSPDEELCGTTHDENCDGLTDEGFPDKGKPCSAGTGECRQTGVYICDPSDLTQTKCTVTGGMKTDEICDGKDNDCNGVIDNGNPGGGVVACSSGMNGDCGPGHLQCISGGMVCVSDAPNGNPEICDGKDNNCDGIVDNDFHINDDCDRTDDLDMCKEGKIACDGPFETKCTETGPGHPDICDHKDNDCDGTVDDETNFFDDPRNCGDCGIECLNSNGTEVCQSGKCNPACNFGWQNCDGNLNNGCDTQRNDDGNFWCPESNDYEFRASGDKPKTAHEVSGYGERQFRVRVTEDPSWFEVDALHVQFKLHNPDGVMMQLCVTCLSCGDTNADCSALTADQRIWASASETPATDDDFDALVEVRYRSSERDACENWTLTIFSESDPPDGSINLGCN